MTETGLGGERHPGEPPRTSGQFVSKYKKAPAQQDAMQTHETTLSHLYWYIVPLQPDCPGGGATLFLAGADHGYCEKEKRTRRNNLQSATVSLQVVIGLCKRKETAALKIKAAVSNGRVKLSALRRLFSFAVVRQSIRNIVFVLFSCPSLSK